LFNYAPGHEIGWGGHKLGALLICVLVGNGSSSTALCREERIACLCREQLRVLLHSTPDKVEHKFHAPSALFPFERSYGTQRAEGWVVPEQVRTQRREKSLSSSGNLIPISRSFEPQLSPEGARLPGIKLGQNDKQEPAALAYGSEE